MPYFVYILKSSKNNKLYKGFTTNLIDRLRRHNNYQTINFDIDNGPFELIWYCQFIDKYKALKFEKYLKSGSGRAFINKHFI